MPDERPDWQDGRPVESETAVVPRDEAGRIERPDWTGEQVPSAPVVAADSATEPVASGLVAEAPGNVIHPVDVVPASIFAAPEDVGPEAAPALDMAKSVLAEDAGWSDTISGFTEQLSPAAQNVLVVEMASGPDAEADPLTPDQIVDFTSTSEGRELWREWGEGAPEKASMARARLSRLVDTLPEHEVDVFHGLVESLPPAAFKEALRQLAG